MIRFYNSLTKKVENFIPLEDGKVNLYTCGPTVYDTAHIGNFRTFLFEDLLKRFLIEAGYSVTHVMNITDVDDKTIRKAADEGTSLKEITGRYTDQFFRDIKFLKMLPADLYPRATDHIPDMISMIGKLIEQGHAYRTNDDSIYFKIASFNAYGRLTNIRIDEQRATDRIQSDEYSKENPHDFALWKSWKEEDGAVYWNSPWGRGRPGWHIECSVMSTRYLGDYFDIHCGGVDNVFPHHENEIAQSVCATGSPFVKYWLHSEHLLIEKSKMSKSSGNFFTLSDLKDMKCSPEMIRYILLSTHYRSKLSFSDEKIQESRKVIQRIGDFYDRLANHPITESDSPPAQEKAFLKVLGNDLDSPKALALFFDWIRKTNSLMDQGELSPEMAGAARKFIDVVDRIFGLIPGEAEIPVEIMELVNMREKARQGRQWNHADQLREKLSDEGWNIEDTQDGPRVKKKS